jgi:hypothetical protein
MKKRGLFVLVALAAVSVVEVPAFSHGSGEWNTVPAQKKGMRIVSAALSDNGKSGGECKPWVQEVVRRATGGHVQVPQNAADVSGSWKSDPTGHVQNLGKTIATARPGDIVQMVIRTSKGAPIPHTAIVATNNGKAIQWLESNWDDDRKVQTRRNQPVSEFLKSVIDNQYTVYRIN